jgi:GTP-binding protein Era
MTKKHGIIAFVGAPNVGKSTLTNAILGQKLSIVSPKAQTTRNSIKAIAIDGEKQLVIIDTPGIFIPKDDRALERNIARAAWSGLRQAQHICLLIDAENGLNPKHFHIIKDLQKENIPLTVIINKMDLVKKSALLAIMVKVAELGVADIIPISALTGNGLEELKKFLYAKCTLDGWIFDEEQITDAPMRYIASEITREKLFLYLDQELPYSITVKTDSYEVLDNGQVKIHQTIFVLKESQKTIIVGKKGEMIKRVGSEARKDLAEIVQNKVHLFLFVKVKENWMSNKESYEQYGA